MVRRAYQQRSLVEVLLPDADKLWDPTLRRIDALLDDESLVDRVTAALAQRHPQSPRRGRLGTPAAVVLRILVLKHLYDWSFDECEREVRGSLVYRAFCRIDGERVPDAKTLIRLAHVLDPTVLKDLLAQLVMVGRAKRIIHGRRLRVDTTVVETNIHYPTDATLLGDGVRVLTRTLQRLGERVRKRTRSVARRVFEIAQRSRTAGQRAKPAVRERSKARMKALYQELMGIARGVVRQAEAALARARRAQEHSDVARDDRVGQADRGADPRPDVARRYALSGQGRQSLRAAHRDHPQGQAGQTHGVRARREDPGGRGAVHHRLRGV